MKNEKNSDIMNFLSGDIELPEGLSKENMIKKLEKSKASPETAQSNVKAFEPKKKKNALLRVAASAAAVFVVASGAFAVYRTGFGSKRPVNTVTATAQQIVVSPKQDVADREQTAAPQEKPSKAEPSFKALDLGLGKASLSTFKSEKDFKNYFLNIKKNYTTYFEGFNGKGVDMAKGVPVTAAAPAQSAESSSDSAKRTDGTSSAKTNTQVDGVDEGDIVKTDSRYIYTVNSDNYLSIIDGESLTLVCQRKLRSASSKLDLLVDEIYLDGNRLVVTGVEYEKSDDGNANVGYNDSVCKVGFFRKALGSVAIVYDITDRSNPAEKRRVAQDGTVISSRMVGSYLYTATEYCPNFGDENPKYTPEVDGTALDYSEVYVRDTESERTSASYVILSGFDTADEKSEVSKASVLSDGYITYCSQDTFYVASSVYDEKKSLDTTVINAFSIKDGAVAYKASGIVPGNVGGQYGMDQNGKYFRICTDGYNSKTDRDYTSLYVLDEGLNVIGRLEDIAKDEELKSTRFMGDTVYVVTFKNTDPLFAIDLSKPNEPKMLGEVKLPGFSQYLHPISENLLVGIGYDGDDEEADFSTLKVSLFDVSNKKQPKELSSLVIKNCSFNVDSSSAKEFVMLDENSFGIPLRKENSKILKNGDYSYSERCVFKVFTVKDGKLFEKKTYSHGDITDYGMFRGTFIGKKVFTLDRHSIKRFDMESAKNEGTLTYFEEKEKSAGTDITVKGEVPTAAAASSAPSAK